MICLFTKFNIKFSLIVATSLVATIRNCNSSCCSVATISNCSYSCCCNQELQLLPLLQSVTAATPVATIRNCNSSCCYNHELQLPLLLQSGTATPPVATIRNCNSPCCYYQELQLLLLLWQHIQLNTLTSLSFMANVAQTFGNKMLLILPLLLRISVLTHLLPDSIFSHI